MKEVNSLLWVTVLSGLATGWLAIIYALANWSDGSNSAALGLIAAALAFGLVGHALFGALRS